MPPPPLVLVLVLGFVAIAGLFVYLAARSGGQWRKKIEAIVVPLGFQPCAAADAPSGLAQRLEMANPRHSGARQIMHLHVRRLAPGASLYVCDYRFASASGRTSGGNWLLVCLVAADLDLPRIAVDGIGPAAGLGGRLARAMASAIAVPGMHPMPSGADGADGAEPQWQVLAEDPAGCAARLPRLLATLRAAPLVASLDAGGDTLILSSVAMMADQVRQRLDAGKLQGLIALATTLWETERRA